MTLSSRRSFTWGGALIAGFALATAAPAQKSPPEFPLTVEKLEAFADPDELALVRSYSYYQKNLDDEEWFLDRQAFVLEEKAVDLTVGLVNYSVLGHVVRTSYSENKHYRLDIGGTKWSPDGTVVNLSLHQFVESDKALLPRHQSMESLSIFGGLEKNADLDLESLLVYPQLKSLHLGYGRLFNIQSVCALENLEWLTAPVSYPQGPIRFSEDCAAPIKMLGFGTARLDDLEVAHLPHLKELYLDSATIRKLAIDGPSLPELEYINLEGADLPEDLSRVELPENLVQLYLQEASDESITQLDLPENLKYLNLTGSQLSDYSFITTAKNLESLVLGGSTFSQFELLEKLPEMKHLSLYDLKLSDKDLEYIAELEQLEYIDMPGAPVTTLMPLEGLHNLHFLLIHDTQVTDYNKIPYFPNLISLGLPNPDDEYGPVGNLPQHIQEMLAASWLDDTFRNYGESCLDQASCTIAPWMIKDNTY